MIILLLIATFAIFLTIDYLRKEKRVTDSETAPAAIVAPRLRPSNVSGFTAPENCRYHPGHTWALQESPALVRVGLDDFAARLAGKIDHIQLPKREQWIRQGQKFATIFRDGNKADLVSLIEGEVTNINEALVNDGSLACHDPYGNGWLMSVHSPDASTNFNNLFGGDLARRWMAEAASRLQAKLPAPAGVRPFLN